MAFNKLLREIAGLVLAVCVAADVLAQAAYPAKPVKIIVPYSAGGPADIYARFIGDRLQKTLGQAFVIENRPGAGAMIGTDAVAKSASDGYTLLMMSNTHTVNESLFTKKSYSLMRDLTPISPINYSDLLLVVHASVPANNLKELIALGKSKPGALNYASSGPGTPYHMAGKVRAIATSGKTRSSITPGVPTLDEAGLPGYDAVIWLGMMAPTATPKPIVDMLNSEIQRIAGLPDVKEIWAKQGAVPMRMTPAEFGKFMEQDIQKWAKVVKFS